MSSVSKPFIFLDRDGTIIRDKHYLSDPQGVELLPYATEGLLLMQEMGFGLIVITNQSGIGRGYFTADQAKSVNEQMINLLSQKNVHIDAVYYCPHTPDDNCLCRKPRTGLIEKASVQFNFTPHDCFVIGDKPCDINLGKNLKARTILISPENKISLKIDQLESPPDYNAKNLIDAANIVQQKNTHNILIL